MRRHRRADSIKLKNIEVNGEDVAITLDSDYTFYAYVLGERIEAASMKSLEAAIRAAAKRDIVVAIEASIVERWGSEIADILITGRHNGTGNILYRREKLKVGERKITTEQLRDEERVCRRLTDDERKEFSRLNAVKRRAEKAVNEWPKSRKLSVATAIKAAVAAQRQL